MTDLYNGIGEPDDIRAYAERDPDAYTHKDDVSGQRELIEKCRYSLSKRAMELLSISQKRMLLELSKIAKRRGAINSRREMVLDARAWHREIRKAREPGYEQGFLSAKQAG